MSVKSLSKLYLALKNDLAGYLLIYFLSVTNGLTVQALLVYTWSHKSNNAVFHAFY